MAIEPKRLPSRWRTLVAIGLALLLTALAFVALLPTWSMAALPFVLASSELSPVLALLAVLWLLVARRLLATRPRPRLVVTGLLVLALVVALRPLVEAALVARRVNVELQALGVAPLPPGATFGTLPAEPAVRHRLVHYAAVDGSPLVMRLYDRADEETSARPIVVVIYGGAWRAGEPAQGARMSDALARRGYLVAAIDYRHAPRFEFPAQLDDVRRSIALVRDSAAAWHGDAMRIALLGRSAGGHLAELAAFKAGDRPVQGVVAIYAPWDLAEGYRDPPSPDPIGVRHVIRDFLGGTPTERPLVYRAASPASYVRAGLPPVLLFYGARDHLVKPEFNREAARALRSADVGVAAVEIPWSEHGFDLVPGGLGERLTWAVTERFLGAVVGNAR